MNITIDVTTDKPGRIVEVDSEAGTLTLRVGHPNPVMDHDNWTHLSPREARTIARALEAAARDCAEEAAG